MNTTSQTLSLELFGTPSVRRADGTVVGGRAVQRHRIALLSVLALSGDRGSSRDRLMAMLWPESDQERTRNLLKVSVYVLRQSLGDDVLLSEGDELRLNPARMDVDVIAFEAALDRGDHERAIALRRGPFLDGFFLANASEFERWVDRERERLAGAYAKALEALAEAADGRGDVSGAVEWWKVRAAEDPYDSRVAFRLMRALEASGNRARALQHGAIHERLLRDELGIEPAPDVRALAERLRAEPASGAPVSHRAPLFRLEMLGGLALRGPNSSVAAGDDRRHDLSLSLLAVLAAGGDDGIARDQLLLLFWPDASHHAARASLDQVLATIRASIDENTVAASDPLKLDRAVIASDVADFERAVSHGQLAEAVEHYRGPFLDGVRLAGSPELEQWVEAQRIRLAAQRDAATERIVRAANRDAEDATATTEGVIRRWRSRWVRRLSWYGVAALALGGLIASWPRTPSADGVPRIAVLPFKSVGADSLEALADAMTEELISMLGREPDRLRAISSSSTFRFRDRQTDVRVIAESLRVYNILEGHLQKVDSRVRLMLRLVDGRDGSLRWTETYEREYRDLLAEPENIARSVAGALDLRLTNTTGTGRLPSRLQGGAVSDRRVAAFDLVIQGERDVLFRSESGRRQSLEFFKRAVETDPTYALAHAELAHILVMTADDSHLRRREQFALAEKAARTAIALDSSLADSHGALGHVLMRDYQLTKAEEELKRAIALDPTHTYFREFLVGLYILMERPRDALEAAQRDLDDSPQSPTAIAELARAWLVNGRCDSAMAQLDRLKHMQPPPARAAHIAAQCYAQRQMWREAIDEVRPVAERNPAQVEPWLGFFLARSGQMEEAKQIRDRLLELASRGEGGASGVAMLYAGFRDYDKAFEWLHRSVDDRSFRFDIMEPAFDELHRKPRFDQLREKLGIQKR